jgi:hypothetical protein
VASGVKEISERMAQILENTTPDVDDWVTYREVMDPREIEEIPHTGSAAQTTRQFQITPLPIEEEGDLQGCYVDQWQRIRIKLRYYVSDKPGGYTEVVNRAASDSARIEDAFLNPSYADNWIGTPLENINVAGSVPLFAGTKSNLLYQSLDYRVMYRLDRDTYGGIFSANFITLADLTAALSGLKYGTTARLIDATTRELIQTYIVTARGVEELNVPTVKPPVARATDSLPQSTSVNYYTVSDSVRLLDLTASAETAWQAQANNVKWTFTPTGGSAKDLCAVVDVNGAAAGSVVSMTGTLTDAAVLTQDGAATAQVAPILLEGPGIIAFSASASSTGTVSASLLYVPAVSGATITAIGP